MEDGVIWDVGPINELVTDVVVGAHGQNTRSSHEGDWVDAILVVKVGIEHSWNLAFGVQAQLLRFNVKT